MWKKTMESFESIAACFAGLVSTRLALTACGIRSSHFLYVTVVGLYWWTFLVGASVRHFEIVTAEIAGGIYHYTTMQLIGRVSAPLRDSKFNVHWFTFL